MLAPNTIVQLINCILRCIIEVRSIISKVKSMHLQMAPRGKHSKKRLVWEKVISKNKNIYHIQIVTHDFNFCHILCRKQAVVLLY